jgi:hypothetical protein
MNAGLRWVGNIPSRRRTILMGAARSLIRHPPDSEWGRRMRRIKGTVSASTGNRAGTLWPEVQSS